MINLDRYHRRYLWLEFLVGIVQLLPISTYWHCFVTLIVTDFKLSLYGLRINALLMVVSQAASIFCQFSNFHLISLILFLFSWYYLPVYNIPAAKKPIGFMRILTKHARIDLFYPCIQGSKVGSKALFPSGVWNTMYDIVNKDSMNRSKLPRWVMFLVTHYYTKMMMPEICYDAQTAPGTYPVMILSHQLGLNSLYSFAREFADYGYFVVTLRHQEEIRNRFPGIEANKPQRIDQLNDRVNDAKMALDFLHSYKIKEILGRTHLNLSDVSILGHSFGATTALKIALDDPRINGLVVCLDPCFYIIPDELSYQVKKIAYKKKTLIIFAEDYYYKHYPDFENDYRARVFIDNCPKYVILSYRFIGSNHASFSEMALIAEGQFRKFGVIRNNDNTTLYLELTLAMIKELDKGHHMYPNYNDLLDKICYKNPQLADKIRKIAVDIGSRPKLVRSSSQNHLKN